jgi:DNA repair protein SbcC/Rad50
MIPQRVKLKGFLSYKDEQEVRFDGSPLWLLAGFNGSGKSSVFDAVTYALFGHHRGGSRNADELINKDCDRLLIEFEFSLDGEAYLIKRTVQRSAKGSPKVTQLISRRQPGANGSGGWVPLEGTSAQKEFQAWVSDHIGLNYETFTSSVLLLQGKAEKLLDSTAKGRHEVLAGIVDLDRYERLHRRADDRRKELDGHAKALRLQLDNLPEVLPIELAEVESLILEAEAARQQAHDEVECWHKLEYQARHWADLQQRLAAARQRWDEAQRLLADAAAIEHDVARLEELRAVLPHVETVVRQRGQLRESEAKTKDLTGQKQALEALLGQQDQALDQARRKRDDLHKRITTEEARHREVAGQLRKASALLEKLKEYEQQQRELARLQGELARLPGDPAEGVRAAREAHDHLAVLAPVVPLLERLHHQRNELRQTCHDEQAAAHALLEVQARGKGCAADVEQFRAKLEEATAARRQADEKAAKARALFEQAKQDLDELSHLQGAKVCRACGQELTAEHLAEEQRRRRKRVTEAEKEAKQAAADQRAAQQQEQALREQFAKLEKTLLEAREEYVNHKHKADQARKDVERLRRDCGQTYRELPNPYKTQVSPEPSADWLETVYPTAEELTAAKHQASGLPAARRRLREAEDRLQQWTNFKGQEASVLQGLTRLQADLPADPQSVRKDHVRLESEEQALDRSLAARRSEAADTQKELDRLSRERERTKQDVVRIEGLLQTEETARKHWRQTQEAALKQLPPAWRQPAEAAGTGDLFGWQGERDDLLKRQTDERGRQLREARVSLEMLGRDRDELERQQEQFPPEARQDPQLVQAKVREAKQAQRFRDEELGQARHRKALLEDQRRQREQVQHDLLQAEKELAHAKTLADLLGRDRLQLHLVRQAERQVVDHANAVLDRLSGGQLYLRLEGEAGGEGNSAKALELEACNRVTGDKPINVAFLSGSQKFRVAVSLALGIGQYASRRHRPIESVIIDEGFGCLDKEGRQAMIQELQNLRGQLRCILLVSHQEEFADAFADGYRFELSDGATKVTRFQR